MGLWDDGIRVFARSAVLPTSRSLVAYVKQQLLLAATYKGNIIPLRRCGIRCKGLFFFGLGTGGQLDNLRRKK